MRQFKKLIEVALPLDAINSACAYEKMPGIGAHPRGLHQWWARRPLAAARAVIFSQMVDDPSEYVDELRDDPRKLRAAEHALKTCDKRASENLEHAATLESILIQQERDRLFEIIRELVQWKNLMNGKVLQAAHNEIRASWRRVCRANEEHMESTSLFDPDNLPGFHDPFSGGGALPMEAQRLGLRSFAGDLNPVAVLINKAMIEVPPELCDHPPVHPGPRARPGNYARTDGIAEDMRYYGQWMHHEACKRLGGIYPRLEGFTNDKEGETVVAWIWARTVYSPDPAYSDVRVPLISSFMLNSKKGEKAWIEPQVDRENGTISYNVRTGGDERDWVIAKQGTKTSGSNFRCLMSGAPILSSYIKAEGKGGRVESKMIGIVVQRKRGKEFRPPTEKQIKAAEVLQADCPKWRPDLPISQDKLASSLQQYGMTKFSDLFSVRQLKSLNVLCELLDEAYRKIEEDAKNTYSNYPHLRQNGGGGGAYARAIKLYLAFAISRCVVFSNTLCRWAPTSPKAMHLFGRQSFGIVWDFVETNTLESVVGGFTPAYEFIADCIATLPGRGVGHAEQMNAAQNHLAWRKVVSTDPPYYDNIIYADLSDFLYVWLRQMLQSDFPELFATMETPKTEELVATPYRHNGKDNAFSFFLAGMSSALRCLAEQTHPAFPVTIYYAFKQVETTGGAETIRTGWETFLEAVIQAGFAITGTWPVQSEQAYRMISMGKNAMASSIVLVCRKRSESLPSTSRREFASVLRSELQKALPQLQHERVAPVDLAQAAIGPGMAVFTRFSKVVNMEGQTLTVRDALTMINDMLDELLASQESRFDSATRWAIVWFEQFGFTEGDYGKAETLSTAKNISVDNLTQAGILSSEGGKVWLTRPEDLGDIDQRRLTAWGSIHLFIRVLESEGEEAASRLIGRPGIQPDIIPELCYRLYSICERTQRASDARAYNSLVQSWPEIVRLASAGAPQAVEHSDLLDNE